MQTSVRSSAAAAAPGITWTGFVLEVCVSLWGVEGCSGLSTKCGEVAEKFAKREAGKRAFCFLARSHSSTLGSCCDWCSNALFGCPPVSKSLDGFPQGPKSCFPRFHMMTLLTFLATMKVTPAVMRPEPNLKQVAAGTVRIIYPIMEPPRNPKS